MRRIYLVRHGQAAPAGILAGQTDYPLTEAGRQEIEALRASLSDVKFDLALVSPLTRARQTLAILSDGVELPTRIEPGLSEISLGLWEGLTKTEIQARWPLHWAWRGKNLARNQAPGGESLEVLAQRVWPVFDRIKAAAGEKTLVVAHQAVNRVILAREKGWPLEKALDIAQPTGALTILEIL
ncbi:MAG: histidine phosphatase family protein [Deltaproteobacteria bacterium]|jgi:probable phosphoglycerate mutase|nr:histidine phosphatase family protein [Deltaproteobacteria bacterium]